jgi:hypothetical protein
MEETIEQKIIRNVQGNYAIYKTTEVVGEKANVPNVEWEESEEIDKFFMFAKNLGAKVVYITEGEEDDEEGNTKNSIVQVGFLHQGIMHHIDFSEEDDYDEDDEEDDEEYDSEEDDELEDETEESESQPAPKNTNQFIGGSSF